MFEYIRLNKTNKTWILNLANSFFASFYFWSNGGEIVGDPRPQHATKPSFFLFTTKNHFNKSRYFKAKQENAKIEQLHLQHKVKSSSFVEGAVT